MPLTPEERAWADKKMAAGVSPEDIVETIAERRRLMSVDTAFEPGEPSVVPGAGPGPGELPVTGPPDITSMLQIPRLIMGLRADPMNTLIKYGKTIGEEGGKAGASYLSGEALARGVGMLPLPPSIKVPLTLAGRLGGQALGQYGGEIGRQKIMGEPVDVERAAREARIVGYTGGAMTAVGALGAYAGGVPRKEIGGGIMDPRRNLRKPTPENWYTLGRDVIEDTQAQTLVKTQGRRAMEDIMRVADSSNLKVNGLEMVNLMRRSVSKSNLPTLKGADAKMLQMADDVEREVLAKSPSGFLSPSEFDEIFQRDFTRPKFDAANVPEWGPDFKGMHSRVRDNIAEYFYKELGPEMGQAAKQAHEVLGIRETLEGELFPRTGEPRPGRTGQKLRSTLSKTNIAGIDTRKALENYDMAYPGKDFSGRLARLDVQEAFSPIGRAESQELAQLGIMNYKPRGLVSAGLVKAARKLLMWGGNSPAGVAARSLAADIVGEAQRVDAGEQPSP